MLGGTRGDEQSPARLLTEVERLNNASCKDGRLDTLDIVQGDQVSALAPRTCSGGTWNSLSGIQRAAPARRNRP